MEEPLPPGHYHRIPSRKKKNVGIIGIPSSLFLITLIVTTSVLLYCSNNVISVFGVSGAGAPSSIALTEESSDDEVQSDTQPVHHLAMFKGCRSNADVVECFQSCWDEYKLSSTFRAALQLKGKRVNITKYIWERYNKTKKKNSRYGCLVGCLTNIPRTLCKAKCTPPLTQFIGEKCIYRRNRTGEGFPFLDPVTTLITEGFRTCIIEEVFEKDQDTIPISLCDRSTAVNNDRPVGEKRAMCAEAVNDCFIKLNADPDPANRTIEKFQLCVEYQLMEEHLLLIRETNYCEEYYKAKLNPDERPPPVVNPNPGMMSTTTEAMSSTTGDSTTEESTTAESTTAESTTAESTTEESSTAESSSTETVTQETATSTMAPLGPGPNPNPNPNPSPLIPQSSPKEDLTKGECDMDIVKNYMPNELCEEMCDIISSDTPFDKCVEECDRLTYPLCYEACIVDVQCYQACLSTDSEAITIGETEPLTLKCFAYCNGDYEQKHENWVNKTTKMSRMQELAERKCKLEPTSGNLEMLAKEALQKEPGLINIVFENFNVEDYGWLLSYRLPEECNEQCHNEEDEHLDTCLLNFACTSPLANNVKDELCDENPLRVVALIQYAAAKKLTLKYNVVNDTFKMRDPTTGLSNSPYLFDKDDKVASDKLIELMEFVKNETDCDPNCENNDWVGEANAECVINCFKEKRETCEYIQRKTVDLTDFSTCQWLVNLAYTSDPKDILGTYFNDKASYDEKDKLERPETTQFLQQTTLRENGSTGYFVFPYFIIIRATCDESNYDDEFYRLLMSGNYPAITVTYHPQTARDEYQSVLSTVFESTLINLKRSSDDILVPLNPQDRRKEDDLGQDDIIEDWCHLKMCYPAFAIPHPMYQLPIFEVDIHSQNVFEELAHHAFVTSFHLTSAIGSGELFVSDAHENVVSVATPRDFFPNNRVSTVDDASLAERAVFCDTHPNTCPLIADDEDDAHVDHEDIFEAHFTFPTAPQIAIAGFYSPNLLIIGDPDMTKYDLVNWTIPTPKHNVPIFGSDHPCIYTRIFNDTINTTMPLYSKIDYSDAAYPINYYRMRYAHKAYHKPPNGHGIFDVIALEDRFILITANGLVSMYGNTNATLSAQKAFKVEASEKLKKCFKFMRTARVSQTFTDLVVGVTYNYDYRNGSADKNVDHVDYIRQEIWFGRLTKSGESLGWTQLKTSQNIADDEDVEYSIPAEPDSGNVVPLAPGKPFRPPPLNSDTLSEVELICYKVYKERISMKDVHINRYLEGWCEALDATPVVTKKDTMQLLIRMTVMYNGIGSSGAGTRVLLYVVASHTIDSEKKSNRNEKVLWTIDGIIPRIPCIASHKESVKNLMTFDNQYFTQANPNSNGTGLKYGCHAIFNDTNFKDYWIYVNRITYTASYTNHMFLYGARLIHSADGGKSYVANTDFPRLDKGNKLQHKLKDPSHRIITMAFGQTGQFAFLTNERELWMGNTGTTELLRLRPSLGYHATQAIVSHKRGLQEGTPFALMFEHSEELFEMVTLSGKDGRVEDILKRQVPVSLILKQSHLQEQIEISRSYLLKNNLKLIEAGIPWLHYHDLNIKGDSAWTLYCPFNSPFFKENYTEKYSRDQIFSFAPPEQHPALSNFTRSLEFRSLIAYQVISFGLTWNSFFDVHYSPYSNVEWDPFSVYHREKKENASIGEVRFLSIDREDIHSEEVAENSKIDGILLYTNHYTRVSTDDESHVIKEAYYLDYGKAILLKLKFSIKNPSALGNTDYFRQHITDIQMNVDNGNGSLILIDTERSVPGAEASVEFIVIIKIIQSEKLPLEQHPPGKNLIPVPVYFHFIGAFGSCLNTPENRLIKDTQRTTVFVGCQPATDLLFNWNATLRSIKFRDKKKHYGKGEDCYEDNLVCFFARLPMILFFDVYDIAKQNYVPYTGNYIMRVVGGGYSNKSIKSYDKQEIEAYNIPGVSDVSLIWNEWDLETQKKVDRQANMWNEDGNTKATIKDTSKEIVLTSGVSAIQWACHTLSPCARIAPNARLQAVYWFEIEVTNKNVDNSTLCLFHKKFTIMLYGFPPSPETQLLTTILFCLGMIGMLYLLFICFRGHKRVWRTTKIKLYGWYQIVKDTFPKPLKKHHAETRAFGHTQEEKDNIILSLQGHLKIPPVVGRVDSGGASPRSPASGNASPLGSRKYKRGDHRMSLGSGASSEASMSSRYSRSQLDILRPIAARHGPATWTDMVYEQIIAKRLSAIVDKNNKLRQNILRRVSVHDATDENEAIYEKEHKRTVSQESIFAQPK